MRFRVLGPTRVEGDAADVPRGTRLRGLLAMLLLEAGHAVPTERLIDGLYGQRPPHGAANALQSLVSRLRRALPDGPDGTPVVRHDAAGYRLDVPADQVDAHRFARLAADGRRALHSGSVQHAADLLGQGLELWRGPALADLTGLPFAAAQAGRLEEQRLGAVEDHCEATLRAGRPEEAATRLRQLAAEHPLRERCRGLLMRALQQSGRRAEALVEFDAARRLLAEELGTDPSAELTAIHLELLRQEDPAPAARPAPSRIGLPSQLTSFVGRDQEVDRVERLLRTRRLVTLTGPGGTGKTRLAVELAWRHPTDSCLVDLSEVRADSEVVAAVSAALDLREAGLRSPRTGPALTQRLATALADRPLLLVLDNCEYVLTGAADLATRLLAACPHLVVLATSREPLGVTGEAIRRLSGLALPAQGSERADSDAVRLFVERATDADPDFALTPDTTPAVLHICRALDGLPLGIELAAARLRALPVTEVGARLDDRFRLLSRGSRTAQPRHQTLRAVVEWSWGLLDERERALARRLTVFVGGATLPAVAEVVGLAESDALDLLTGLVDKSLLETDGGRYRMLETVRTFCAEHLRRSGESTAVRRAHALHFQGLAERADPHLRAPEQLEWLRTLDAERDNLHAALRNATEDGEPATACGLGAALSFYWWLRGARREAAELCRAALAGLPPTLPCDDPLWEDYAVCVLTAALTGVDDAWLAAAHAEVDRTYLTTLTTRSTAPRWPFGMYLNAASAGPPTRDVAQLRRLYGDSPVLRTSAWVRRMHSIGLGSLSLQVEGSDAAEYHFRRALEGFTGLGDRWGMMLSVSGLGEALHVRGDHGAAVTALDEGLRLAGELGSMVDRAELLRVRGEANLAGGDLAAATDDFTRSLGAAREAGSPEGTAGAHAGLSRVAERRGALGEARRLADRALAECPEGWFSADSTRDGIRRLLDRLPDAP